MKNYKTIICKDCPLKIKPTSGSQKRCGNCSRIFKQQKLNKWRREHPEQTTVRSHYYWIVKKKGNNVNYFSMPFFDEWNPDKGGSHKVGGKWILANLGPRPKGSSLHIINHEKGFVPGNIEWTFRVKQNSQQLYKIVAQLKNRIRILEQELRNARRK